MLCSLVSFSLFLKYLRAVFLLEEYFFLKVPAIGFVIILFFFLLTTACQLEQIQIEDWSPEFVTPLINTRITIADLIPEEGSTQYDQHGFISLSVKDDSVYVS